MNNTAGYGQSVKIKTPQTGWVSSNPWISAPGGPVLSNGYYSYVTIISDDIVKSLKADETLAFCGLQIGFACDDHLHAIVMNGKVYQGFSPQRFDHYGWEQAMTYIALSKINWKINGTNTIEFIVHNNNSNNLGNHQSTYANQENLTGFAGSIQAVYQKTGKTTPTDPIDPVTPGDPSEPEKPDNPKVPESGL